MPYATRFALFLCLAAGVLAPGSAHAAPKTVCTVTVNSADEKETIRQRLPKGEYNFVELVEKNRPDWLRSSCQKKVSCDVLVISGHFNAGDTFYSDQVDRNEYLSMDELERASCSASCPDLFAHLKEVYLFGCESLNPDATKYSSSYGESGRDRMRRLFPNVPAIYGFYSSAPVGATAAVLLNRYFDAGGARDFGTGDVSAKLLKIFGHNHITHTAGVRPSEPLAAYRREVCQFYDDGLAAAKKLAFVHTLLRDESQVNTFFERIEKLLSSVTDAEKQSPELAHTLAEISADDVARARYMSVMRHAEQPTRRARMIALAGTLGWLSPDQQRAERVALINDLVASRSMGYAEVDLVCSLNANHELDGARAQVIIPAQRVGHAGPVAAMACLGDAEAHDQMLRTLASPDDKDVQIAQTYLRNRPITEKHELREIARGIARASGAAQVRAIDVIARLDISDHEVLQELSRTFAQTKSIEVQRALAEAFIRSDPKAFSKPDLLGIVREHRIKARGGGHDLIDTLIERLQG